MKSPLSKIISGGQTGVDAGALHAARELGIQTGGVAPLGWMTENGSQEKLLREFGLVECEEGGYAARTRRNVLISDGTLLIGPHDRGGTRLTFDVAAEMSKPVFHVEYSPVATDWSSSIEQFRSWLEYARVETLNVAGSRESGAPGIAEFTRRFLVAALSPSASSDDDAF